MELRKAERNHKTPLPKNARHVKMKVFQKKVAKAGNFE
jgi:hypothetical protein